MSASLDRSLSGGGAGGSAAGGSAGGSDSLALAFYDEWQVWQFLERYFRSQFPLRDITWRSASTNAVITIPSLPVQILDHAHAIFRNLDAVNNYRAPYVHINFVVCESADSYKNTIKSKIKAWIDERTEKQEEWLLVYVPVGTQNNTHDMYVKIYARLAADFCQKTAGDKSCILTIFEGGLSGPIAGARNDAIQQQQEQWIDLTMKLKMTIGNTFIMRCKAYAEEVKKLEEARPSSAGGASSGSSTANKQPPLRTASSTASTSSSAEATVEIAGGGAGAQQPKKKAGEGEDDEWDFFALFFAKESLALMHEQLQLPFEALTHYQELTAMCNLYQTFLPSSPPKALMMFQNKAGLPILDFPVFEFRVKLESQEVGILEVQQYLFSREAFFLQLLCRHADIMRRIHSFLILQFQTLRRISSLSVSRECAELWAFISSWDVFSIAEEFLKQQIAAQQPPASSSPVPGLAPSSPKELRRQEGGLPKDLMVGSPPIGEEVVMRGGGGVSSSNRVDQAALAANMAMSRHLAELLDFCRLRFLGLGQSLMKQDVLEQESVVCAARRELVTPNLPPTDGDGSSSNNKTTTTDVLNVSLKGGLGTDIDPSSAGGGEGSSFDDPRHVAVNLGAMLSRMEWIRQSISSIQAFDEQYLRITEALTRHLEKASRDRFVGRVQAERAIALLKMDDFEEARKILRSLVEGCFRRDYWIPILSQLIRKLAVCEKERGSSRSYVSAVLQILSLQCLDEAAGIFYLQEVDTFVRNRLTSRMLRSFSLLATARIKVSGDAKMSGNTGAKVELGSKASVTVWINLNLKQPLTVDGLSLMLGELSDLKRRRRIGSEMGWIASSSSSSAEAESAGALTPGSPRAGGALSPRGGGSTLKNTTGISGMEDGGATTGGGNEVKENELLSWRLPGPLTLKPGVNELELSTTLLPPPGTYVFEKLVVYWGTLVLEQDQITALDTDTLELVTKQRPPPRRFSALSRAPGKRGVPITVVAKPPVASLAVVSYPVLPPDATHVHHVSVLLDTKTDTLTSPVLTLSQSPLGLAAQGSALLAFFEERKENSDGSGEGVQEEKRDTEPVPVKEESVPVTWDGSIASVTLPHELPPDTRIVVTLALNPLAEVVEGFIKGRQDHQLNVSMQVELSAELNKETFKAFYAQCALSLPPQQEGEGGGSEKASGTAPLSPRRKGPPKPPHPVCVSSPRNGPVSSSSSSSSSSPWSSGILEDALKRTVLSANVDVVIQQPFSVTISVQGCSHWKASRRYFVQALLRSRAPISVTLHECRLKLPPSYREVIHQQGVKGMENANGTGSNAHLKDLTLAPSQDVRYTYLIERIPGAAQPSTPTAGSGGAAGAKEMPSKMSVMADYTWDSPPLPKGQQIGGGGGLGLRRGCPHHPPQQQSFERYFQDSAMLNRGDNLRTFVIRAQLMSSSPSDEEPKTAGGERKGGNREDTSSQPTSPGLQQAPLLPQSAPATPGDVEERGVVVGHFQNRVTEGLVGVALRLELLVELSEEAIKEGMAAAAADNEEGEGSRRRTLRLAYEVTADPADWAISGLAKGTLEIIPGQPPVTLTCKVVPVRIGMLACPSLVFQPVDVRRAVSPKSRRKNNVRWVGPRDIQVFPSLAKRLYPLNRT